jgi:hypothetical protein
MKRVLAIFAMASHAIVVVITVVFPHVVGPTFWAVKVRRFCVSFTVIVFMHAGYLPAQAI